MEWYSWFVVLIGVLSLASVASARPVDPYTDVSCSGGDCEAVISEFPMYGVVNGVLTPLARLKSFLNTTDITCEVLEDNVTGVRCVDFNATSITVNVTLKDVSALARSMPVRLLKADGVLSAPSIGATNIIVNKKGGYAVATVGWNFMDELHIGNESSTVTLSPANRKRHELTTNFCYPDDGSMTCLFYDPTCSAFGLTFNGDYPTRSYYSGACGAYPDCLPSPTPSPRSGEFFHFRYSLSGLSSDTSLLNVSYAILNVFFAGSSATYKIYADHEDDSSSTPCATTHTIDSYGQPASQAGAVNRTFVETNHVQSSASIGAENTYFVVYGNAIGTQNRPYNNATLTVTYSIIDTCQVPSSGYWNIKQACNITNASVSANIDVNITNGGSLILSNANLTVNSIAWVPDAAYAYRFAWDVPASRVVLA